MLCYASSKDGLLVEIKIDHFSTKTLGRDFISGGNYDYAATQTEGTRITIKAHSDADPKLIINAIRSMAELPSPKVYPPTWASGLIIFEYDNLSVTDEDLCSKIRQVIEYADIKNPSKRIDENQETVYSYYGDQKRKIRTKSPMFEDTTRPIEDTHLGKSRSSRTSKIVIIVVAVSALCAMIGAFAYTSPNNSQFHLIPQSPNYMVNSTWVQDFITIVNEYRANSSAPPLAYSPVLSSFAQLRFNDMQQNYQISHWNATTDMTNFMNSNPSFFSSSYMEMDEEYFDMTPASSPQAFANELMQTAPAHWSGLINSNYTVYGYYIGTGLDVIGNCPAGQNTNTEITSEGVNMTQLWIQQGCQPETVTTTILVIELAN
ncbi:MAG: CAP domain-containing protein [Conexivisphaerales archaeon]